MSGVSILIIAVLGALIAARGLNSERALTAVERVVVWWWLGVIGLGVAGELSPGSFGDALVGVLFTGLGAFIALNICSVADHLATRRVGLFFRKTQSVARWRWYGVMLIPAGILWAGGVFTAS
jgi:hypothetical protein